MRVLFVLVLFCVFRTASGFVIPSNHNALTTTLNADAVLYEDRWVPDDVRSKRSKKIRDKLLGDMESRFVPEGECPLLEAQKEKDRKKRRSRSKKDGHPLLTQMTKFLDRYVVKTQPVDPNC